VVDGIERLSPVDRWLFLGGFSFGRFRQRGSRRRGGAGQGDGLLATGHRVLPWLPQVFETTFGEVSLHRLIEELLPVSIRTGIHDGDDDVFSGRQWKEFSGDLLQRHGSNGREILMEMYDWYEATCGEKRLPKQTLPLTKVGVEN
jgi:hypothetical protein